ncbi:MAG: M56 family metallopeptidase [Cytophagaceae bacterium]|nr:M56 family metallopeptidase [Gemmatimonadaceae bacterium]
MALPTDLLLTPADSARAVGDVYGVSLLATVPLFVAVAAFVALRGKGAGTRVLIWRSAVVAMLAVYVGRFLPFHWMAWVVPEGLASPLVALGRAQLAVAGSIPHAGEGDGWFVPGIMVLYWLGVLAVLFPMLVARSRLARMLPGATVLDDAGWRRLVDGLRESSGVRRPVRLVMSPAVRVPMTWGLLHPVIVLPSAAAAWTPSQRRAALLHELLHVRSSDPAFVIAARVACACFWFHPGVWWVASRLAQDAELACDDRVLLAGVRRSDYAELLARALDGTTRLPAGALALVRHAGLRDRLHAIVDTSRVLRAPSRLAGVVAVAATFAVAAPVATVRVAPTRDVLTTLMQDTRWESRAYAVVRLAQRRDSVDVARAAARHDPNPRVRAWAQYALAQGPDAVAPRSLVLPD